MNIKISLLLLCLFCNLALSKIFIADEGNVTKTLKTNPISPHRSHKWETDLDSIKFHMMYGYDSQGGRQYSIICQVDDKRVIPGKIMHGKATYFDEKNEIECTHWRFVEGRLVHESDFDKVKCRAPLGVDGKDKYYNGVAHLHSGYEIGSVAANLKWIIYSRDGEIRYKKNNFYIIC